MPNSLHYFKPGQDVTAVATTDVVGGRFVTIGAGGVYNQPNVAHSAADDRPFGVAARDAEAGEHFLVHTGGIVPVTVAASVEAGAYVAAGADGKAVSADAATAHGIVLADAAADAEASVHLL